MQWRNGFTLIELMVVLAIIAIISIVTAVSLFSARNTNNLTNAANEIGALLREAQSRSANQIQGAAWGVHFDNTNPSAPFYALFSGTYSTSTRVDFSPLPTNIIFNTTTLASGTSLNISFAQITGLPSTSTAITLDLAPNNSSSSTISVSSAGLITY